MIPHIFKPGDLAVICNKECGCCNGLQVTVERGPRIERIWVVPGLLDGDYFGYVVRTASGERIFCEPHQLRPIEPPTVHPAAVESDDTPNAPTKFDPAIWAPNTERVQ